MENVWDALVLRRESKQRKRRKSKPLAA